MSTPPPKLRATTKKSLPSRFEISSKWALENSNSPLAEMLLRDNNDDEGMGGREGFEDYGEDDGDRGGGGRSGNTIPDLELEMSDEVSLPTWQTTNATISGQQQQQQRKRGIDTPLPTYHLLTLPFHIFLFFLHLQAPLPPHR